MSRASRAGLALLLLVLAWGLDQWQRPGQPGAAQAHYGAEPTQHGAAPAPQALRLQPSARGSIPMPPDAAAAHASNLLAMPTADAAMLTAFWFAGDRESAPNVQIAASRDPGLAWRVACHAFTNGAKTAPSLV